MKLSPLTQKLLWWWRGLVVLLLVLVQVAWQPVPGAVAAPRSRVEKIVKPAGVHPRPAYAPAAGVTLNVPAQVAIGANFSFTATFDNTAANAAGNTGYGPFIDLYFPVTGSDGDDGINFASATYLGQPVTATQLTFPGPGPTGCVNHPYAIAPATGAPLQVCGLSGDRLVVLQLPFGSFTPDQPAAVVTVNATLSNLADLSAPLTLHARGGYQFGATPLQDWCCSPFDATILSQPSTDGTTWSPSASVTPYVVTVAKTYNGPENETATGPNYPRRYTVTADIASGQVVTGLVLNDILPDNMQFVQVILPTAPAGASCTTPGTTTPGGTVSCTFASVTGGAGTADAAFTFEFYIPLNDTTPAPVINASSGDDVLSLNNVTASGNWQPIDPRDPLTPFTADGVGPEHTLTDKSIAIQKGVANVINVGPAGITPGDTLDYTLNFQVSDFFSFQNVTVTDVISDGQHFDTTFTPTLTINGNTYALGAAGMNTANYTVAQNFTGAVASPPVFTIDPAANDGGSTITFRVSDEIITRGQSGKLIGGCVPVAGTGGPTPNCDTASGGYNDGATTGTIHFRTVIQDQFTDTFPSGDASVDHGDVLTDAVTVNGDLLSVSDNSTPTGQSEADGSGASVSIAFGTLTKSIYAINSSTSFSSPVAITPGDTVTYRLRYSLPTSDFETLVLTDYLPLPIYAASEITTFDDVGGFSNPVVIPAAGHVNFGPTDTFRALGGNGVGCFAGAPIGSPPANADGTPCMSIDSASNLVSFNYGNYDDPTNTDTQIDLLFTVTVSSNPFADGMFLTNQANASEGTTNAGSQNLNGIIQVVLTEPVLVFGKSVIASNNPNAIYAPALPSSVTFNVPGTPGARWTGNINSNLLATEGLNSDVTGIEANDLVSFALVIENQGTSSKGAFDIDISDTLPPGFHIPAGGLNLRISYGDNSSAIAYTQPDNSPAVDTDLFAGGIRLVDPGGATGGVCQVHSLTSGKNVIVITYDLQVDSNVNPSQTITNTGTLFNYSGSEGGPDFTTNDLTDDASVTIGQPALDKVLTGTEINTATDDNTHAVIGELATYTLTVTVPQGVVPGGSLTDTLDNGLAFVDVQSVTYASGVSSANTIGTGSAPANVTVANSGGGTGNQLVFDFGDITNTNSDSSVPDTITIVYHAVVLNVAGNQSGTLLNNSAVFAWGASSSVGQATPTANVTVIEPLLQDTKSVVVNGSGTAGDAGDPVEYTIVLSQTPGSQADAFDVTFADLIPAEISPSGFTVVDSLGSVTAADFTLSGNNLTTSSSFDFLFNASRTITIVVDGTLLNTVSPSQLITNTAFVHWTSLDTAVSDRSTYNTSSDERDGSGTPAFNDYTASAAATITIVSVAPVKSIVSTSESFTAESGDGTPGNPRDLAIGEIVRYRLAIDLPEGSSANFTVVDTLPAGLSYLANGTGAPKVSFVADNPMSVPADLAGADNDALPPTFDIPAAHLSVVGQSVTINLGNLVNNDSDGNSEIVVIEFNVLVNNDANANNTDLKNNQFSVTINGSPAGTSNTVGVRVVEPIIPFSAAANNKTVSLSSSPADAGDVATYTVTYTNSGLADAFEVRVLDTLPATSLDLTAVNAPTFNLACQSPTVTDSSNLAGDVVDLSIDRVRVGCTVTFTYTATLRTAVTPNQALTNTAAISYTSLPGANGTISNATGSSTPGAGGTATGERNGSGGAINDYSGSDTASFTTRTVARAKSIVDTEINTTGNTNAQAAIGELVTYRLVITVPEGTTPNLQVVDTLGANMVVTDVCVSGYPSAATPIAASAGLTTSLAGGFADACNDGTAVTNDPVIGAASGTAGRLITWSLGTITNSDTNNANAETITIVYQAVALNVAANQAGGNRTNSAVVSWTGNSLAAATTTVGLVEATVNTSKSVSAGPYDAGDTVTYTLTLANPAAGSTTAFDTSLNDPLPSHFASASVTTVTGGGFTTADFSVTGCPATCVLQTAAAGGIDIPANTTLTITVQATLSATVPAGQTVANTATTQWTSVNDAVVDRSPYNANSDERDGSGGLLGGGALNDYRTQGAVSFTLSTPLIVKQAPTPTTYAVGGTVTYPILVTLPEGLTRSLRVIDQVPAGMLYLSSSVDTTGFSGTVTATPTVTPASPVDGDDMTFDFGDTTTTADGNVTNNSFILNVTLRVLDVPANQTGATLTNAAVLRYVNPNTGTDAADVSSGSQAITITEPRIVTNKTVDITTGVQAGTVLTYTVTFTNTNAPLSNVSTAYDVSTTDVLAQGVAFTALTSCALDAPATDLTAATTVDTSTAGQVTLSGSAWDVSPGSTITCVYTATAQPGLYINGTHTNTVDADWTSLNGVDTNERVYDDSVVRSVDGAQDTDTASFTVSGLSLDKTADVTQVTIGNTVTFTLTINGPNGTIRSLNVADQLPAGLVYNNDAVFSGISAPLSTTVSSPNDGTAAVDLNWNFGDATKSAEPFTIIYSARAADVSTNFVGTTLTNAVALDYHLADNTPATQLTDNVTVTIIEAEITTTKDTVPAALIGVQAGDVVTYSATFANTGNSPAYDVSALDVLAQGMNFTALTSCTLTPGAVDLTASTTVDALSVPGQVSFSGAAWDIPAGGNIACVYTATAQPGIYIDGAHINTIDADWTSLNGANANERSYNDSVVRTVDGTQDTDTASFSSDTITLDKSADVTQVAIGGTVTFTLTIHGPNGTIRNLNIADQLPAGLIYNNDAVFSGISAPTGATVSSPNDGTAAVNITWNFGDATKSAEPFTIVYSARAADVLGNQIGTALPNNVTLDHNFAGGAAAPQLSDSTSVTITEPVIAFGKTIVSLPSPLDAGGVVQYQISYVNGTGANLSTAFDVHITDTLPAQLSLILPVTVTLGGGAAGTTNASAGNSLDVTITSVPPGGSVTVDYSATIQNSVSPGDVIANTSNATWTSLNGPVAGERTGAGGVDDYAASSGQNFTIAAGSTIAKQITATSASHTTGSNVTIGELVTYGLLVTFPEGTTPTDSVVDDLPAGLAVVGGSPQVITTAAASAGLLSADFNGTIGTQNMTVVPGDGGSVTFDYINVIVTGDNDASNNTILLTFQARVTDIAANVSGQVLSNSAINTVGASTTTSNSVDVSVVVPAPLLTKAFANQTTPASGASGILGDVIRMTLTYQNTGTSNAYDVVISDALDSTRISALTPVTTPAGFTYSSSGTNPVTIQYAANAGVAVAPGATLTFQLDFTLTAGNVPGDVIPNTANVTQTTTLDSSTSDGDDANERNIPTSASANLQFNGAELSITKSDGGITTAPGNNVTYTLNYSNYGNIAATNVLLRETVPADTTYDSANNATAWICGLNPAPAGTSCTFSLGTLAAGANGSVTFVVTVANPLAASVTQLSNTATIQGDQPETVTTDNTSTDTTPVVAAPALTIDKDDGLDIVAPGFLLNYTITVTNNGNQDLTGLQLVDTIPPGTAFVSASAGGSFSSGLGQITWPAFALNSGAATTFTVQLQVADLASLGSITSFANTVHVQDDGTNTSGVPIQATDTDTDQLANTNVKTLTGTDQAGSATPNVLIGEILNYAIRIDVPVGTINNLRAVDVLEHGLAFVGCDPTTPISAGSLVLAQNPCTTPSALTVQAEPVTDTNPGSVDAGRRITFDFGSVQNNGATTQSLILNYQVIVLDIADNADGLTGLNNAVEWQWEGGTLAGSATGVNIVEPQLQIEKTVNPLVTMLGNIVTYTIDISHTAQSTAPAFDVLMTDGIPTGLTLVPGSITVSGSAGLPAATVTATATQFSVYWASFPLGETATVTFQASFTGPSPVINSANVEWSSIQIDPNPHLTPQSTFNVHSTERRYDPLSQTINDYRASASATLRKPILPDTGFAPGLNTILPAQPPDKMYDSLGDMWLEIPNLGLRMPIVGIPATASGWDLTWLSNQAGYLEGTTYPSQVGTTGLTGHVYLADGTPGPFLHLGDLSYGNQVILHANGQRYIFEVRTKRVVLPSDTSVFKNDGYTWLTLLTCKEYVASLKKYDYRLAVRAVLVRVENETATK